MKERWILKWPDDGTYFVEVRGGQARWSKEQRRAMRFATAEDARSEAGKWCSDPGPTVVRLVPRGGGRIR
jgi:hypothetical protein